MRTKIISAFPGTGKSYYHNLHPDTTLDSDSSEFSWQYDAVTGEKLRNSWFPKNYIEHIQKNVGKYEIIFVSSHKEVREALKDASLFHYVVYPRQCDKEMFKQRYIKRGSPEPFVNLIMSNWSEWILGCSQPGVGYETHEFDFSRHEMSDFIKMLEIGENICTK